MYTAGKKKKEVEFCCYMSNSSVKCGRVRASSRVRGRAMDFSHFRLYKLEYGIQMNSQSGIVDL